MIKCFIIVLYIFIKKNIFMYIINDVVIKKNKNKIKIKIKIKK